MPSTAIQVTAASRLHFGLFAAGGEGQRPFGGVGVMVEPPHTRLRIVPAERFSIEGAAQDRVAEFVRSWCQYWSRKELPTCRVIVEAVPRMHAGLGTGTQLALSLAQGLNVFWGLTGNGRRQLTPQELAQIVGRGQRSAVGTHGFLSGGLVFDAGCGMEDHDALPAGRREFPETWRFVLIRPTDHQGLFGEDEQRAFARLARDTAETTGELCDEVREQLLPAVEERDFDRFSDSLYRFGKRAGQGFARVQGGSYHGPRLTGLVERLLELGVRGVGQSSWGPTLFALCREQRSAEKLVARLDSEPAAHGAEIWIAQPRNVGATVEWCEGA